VWTSGGEVAVIRQLHPTEGEISVYHIALPAVPADAPADPLAWRPPDRHQTDAGAPPNGPRTPAMPFTAVTRLTSLSLLLLLQR